MLYTLTAEQKERMSELEKLVKSAQARFDSLTPEQQRAERHAQRKSWVIGEMMLEHPEMSRAEAERLWDSLERGV